MMGVIRVGNETVIPNRFGNIEIDNNGKISKFGTIRFRQRRWVSDPANLLYSDLFLRFRDGKYRAAFVEDDIIVFHSSEALSGVAVEGIPGDQIYLVREISRFRVTAGHWLGRIDPETDRISPADRRDLPHVRRANQGIRPPYFSTRGFFFAGAPQGRIVYVLRLGPSPLPIYRVFDPKGKAISFKQEFPLARWAWETSEA